MEQERTAKRALEIFRGYLGSSNGDFFIKKFNEMCGWGLGYGEPWCAVSFNVVVHMAGMTSQEVPWFTGCTYARKVYSGMGRYKKRGEVTPQPGWGVLFDWDGDGSQDHIGMVEYVEGGYLHTIEGNADGTFANGTVKRKVYSLYYSGIDGYITIPYEEEAEMSYDDFKAYMTKYEAEKAEKSAQSWAQPALNFVKENGIMVGDADGRMRPQANITREETAQLIYKAFGGGKDVSGYADKAWKAATEAKIFDGTDPRKPLTREQAAVILGRLGLIPGME